MALVEHSRAVSEVREDILFDVDPTLTENNLDIGVNIILQSSSILLAPPLVGIGIY